MGTSLADALFSGVQKRLLAVLLANPEKSFYFNELEGIINSGTGSLQRELKRLSSSGLVTLTAIGRQKHYQANKNNPIFQELRSIALKTFALADPLSAALARAVPNIRLAFIYGSVARGTDTASSDIDLLVVAEHLGYSELFELLLEVEASLGRKISPTLYSPAELAKKIERGNHFVTRILDQPKIFLIGSENDLPSGKSREFGQDQPDQSREIQPG